MKRKYAVSIIIIVFIFYFLFRKGRAELFCLPDKRVKLSVKDSIEIRKIFKTTEFTFFSEEPEIGFLPPFTLFINDNEKHFVKCYEPVIPDVQIDASGYYYAIDPYCELLDLLRFYEKKYFEEEYIHMADIYYGLIRDSELMELRGKDGNGSSVYAVTDKYPVKDILNKLGKSSDDNRTVDELFGNDPELNSEIVTDGIRIKLTGISSAGYFYYFCREQL